MSVCLSVFNLKDYLISRLMSAYDSFWQLITANNSLWLFMTAYDCLWQLMTAYNSLWQLLTAYDCLWYQNKTEQNSLWLTSMQCLWQLMTAYSFQAVLMTACCWHTVLMTAFDSLWLACSSIKFPNTKSEQLTRTLQCLSCHLEANYPVWVVIMWYLQRVQADIPIVLRLAVSHNRSSETRSYQASPPILRVPRLH